MAAYGGQIAPEDRWKAVHWLRRLQGRALRGREELARP